MRRELTDLRLEVRRLQEALKIGVTTQRLSIVDPDGFERIALEAFENHGHVVIRDRQRTLSAELFAVDGAGEAAVAGIDLVEQGDSVGGFQLVAGQPPRGWVDPEAHTTASRARQRHRT